jgi:hypothetical protein
VKERTAGAGIIDDDDGGGGICEVVDKTLYNCICDFNPHCARVM